MRETKSEIEKKLNPKSTRHNNNDNNNNPIMQLRARVLRFEFSGALVEHLAAFANVHRYDDRKTYKEAWVQWMAHNEVADLFNAEVARLKALGYKGDAADKLYKSGRYYFRQKTCGPGNYVPSIAPRTPPPNLSLHAEPLGVRGALVAPRKYVLLSHALLVAMDDHIERSMQSNNEYTPAMGFSEFCKLHAHDAVLISEVARLVERAGSKTDAAAVRDIIHQKLKKTYKNRYFMMVKNAIN
jgi:hypothetical protein